MTRSRMLALGITYALAGCAGAAPPRAIQHVGAAHLYDARVIAARGPLVPQTGDSCTVEVRSTDDQYFNCRIRIECSGDIVYGLADSGYNACHLDGARPVFARDRNGTRADGDPRLYFDVIGGRVYVSDDAPDVELELDLSGVPDRYDSEAREEPPGA